MTHKQRPKIRRKPKGWRNEPLRHREASLKGQPKRMKTLGINTDPPSEHEINYIENNRSLKAKRMDLEKDSTLKFSKTSKNAYKWRKNPNRIDLIGVDEDEKIQIKKRDEKISRKKTPKHVPHFSKRKSNVDNSIGNNEYYKTKLEDYANKEAENEGIDPQVIDVDSIVDETLTYSENKQLIDEQIKSNSYDDDAAQAQYYAHYQDEE